MNHPRPDTVQGSVTAAFEPVRAAVRNLAAQLEPDSLAVAAYLRGELVVDLVAGNAAPDSLWHTWSTIKPVSGACLLLMVERGLVKLDTPVRDLWPQLAAADARLSIRHVLGHAAGLAHLGAVGAPHSLMDWDASVRRLAANVPAWRGGKAVGEHVFTYGHLVGELVRRIDGRSIGTFLREEITGPLGMDIHIGLTDSHMDRVADTHGLTRAFWARYAGPPGSDRQRAIGAGISDLVVNSRAWRHAEVPAVGGHATARGLARFYDAYLRGELPSGFATPAASGPDRVLGRHVVWTLAGGQRDSDRIGMGGIGGQWAGALPEYGLAWAILTSQISDRRPANLIGQLLTRGADRAGDR